MTKWTRPACDIAGELRPKSGKKGHRGRPHKVRVSEERLRDPYKQWKLTEADVEAFARWDDYVRAVDDLLERTDTAFAPQLPTTRRIISAATRGFALTSCAVNTWK